MISIQPKWVEKILNGEKTIEIRKTMPKCEFPIDAYIYCTKDRKDYLTMMDDDKHTIVLDRDGEIGSWGYNVLNGKVVAKFTLNEISNIYASRQGCGRLNNPEDFEWFYSLGLVADDKNSSVYSQDYGVKTKKWSCLSQEELHKYLKYKDGYAWHIDNLEIFDKPKELSEFTYHCVDDSKCENCPYFYCHNTENDSEKGCSCDCKKPINKAPQSWQFVEVE